MFIKGFICGFIFACVCAAVWTIAKKLHTDRNGVQPDNPQYDECAKSTDGLSDTINELRNSVADAQNAIDGTISLLEKIKERQ